MSTTIDQRVVEMQFDNRNFESNVSTTMSTLDKLKQSLSFSGASKGLENVNAAANKCDMSTLGNAVETVKARFSALEVMGVTALANITNSAVNAGKKMVKALTIDPIKTGFQEYETQINSVQTILANTQSKGSTLTDVNRALDELNTYADKTIYNFTEMTRNIGTFTAAGVDLDKSVTSIKGIANLAAISGSTSQQASTAMYQLSQALASGTVKLMDWNSVVNAGMGGQVFQDALKRTAKNMGTDVDALIEKYGSFRESLSQGEWLTADVLTETLTQLSGAYTKADLLAKGYTESQAKEILELADTAVQAATKVKTFSQLWDTLKEAAQSGWTQSWEIIVGDFEEAKAFLTQISDVIGGMLNDSAQARNELLSSGLSSGWKQLLGAGIADEEGFKDIFKSVAKEHGIAFDKMAKKNETFEQTLARGLKSGKINSDMLTESVSKMAKKMSKMSAEELKAAGYTKEHVDQIKKLDKGLKDGSISMDDFVDKMMKPSGRQNIIDSLWNAFEGLMSVVKPIKEAFRDIFPPATGEQLYKLTENLKKFTEGLKLSDSASDKIKRTFKGLFSIFDLLRKGITTVVEALFGLSQSDGIKSLADMLLDITASIGDFFTSINEGFNADGLAGGLSSLTSGISGFIEKAVSGLRGFTDILSSIGQFVVKVAKNIWNALKEVFTWISENVSAGDIFAGLAGGGIFAAAKKLIGLFDKIKDVISNLFDKKDGGGSKFSEILDSVKESIDSFTSGIKIGSLVAIAIAVTLLSSALKTISSLEVTDISKGLFGIGAMIAMLTAAFKSLQKALFAFEPDGIMKAGASMILIAAAVGILAKAIVELSELSFNEIVQGLIGIGGGIFALVAGINAISGTEINLSTSVAILALAVSCKILASALQSFGGMSLDEIGRGLVAMGGALGELAVVSAALGVTGFIGTLGAGTLTLAVQELDKLAEALQKFGSMSWDEIGRGLTAMGAALGEVALGSLLNTFSGIGAVSLSTVAEPLGTLADSLKKWAGVSLPDNLSADLSSLAKGVRSFTFDGMGASALTTAAPALGSLADAMKKWSGVTVPEGIGEKLGQLADGVQAFSFAFMGGWSLETVAGPLGALADSIKKWNGVTIPENLSTQLGSLADGVQSFSWAFMGGWSLETITGPLGALADAVKKWNGISISDGLSEQIGKLAGAVGKWALVSVPANVGKNMSSIADAANKLSGIGYTTITSGLSKLATSLTKFASSSKSLSGIGKSITSNIVTPITKASSTMSKAGANLISSLTRGINSKKGSVKTAASSIVTSAVSAVKSKASTLNTVGSTLANSFAKGLQSKKSAAVSAVTKTVSEMTSKIKGQSSTFNRLGSTLMSRFVSGINSRKSAAASSLSSVLSTAAARARGYYGSFYSAGRYVASGFAAGISAGTYAAVARARAMAASAAAAARAALKIKSPSRVFYQIGSYVSQGFTNALSDSASKVYRTASDMANSAKSGFNSAIGKIQDIIDGNINVQPTIRPVVDLSGVRDGADAMNDMLGVNPSISALSNIGSINATMKRNNQNGETHELVSVINKLRRDLGNIGNTTYNVNGVTYDDGSNITDAVKTIVRAAVVERRK